MLGKLKIFSGNSNILLADKICSYLGLTLGKATVKSFSDGEIFVEIEENVRGNDIFVLQSFCMPVNHYIMEFLIMVDALKRASAKRVTAVIPYYGYARQDRKVAPRTPISAKLVADILSTAGTNRVLTIDLHAGQIQGFFNIPVDHLYATPVLLKFIAENFKNDIVIVSPDAGGVERARAYAKRLNCGLAIIDKRRVGPNVAEIMNIIGEVESKTAVLVDDMVDTAGTLTQAAKALKDKGAASVYACCTHPVFSGNAVEKIGQSEISKIIVTDTIPLSEKASNSKKIKVLTISEILGEAIKRIHEESSVSSLFV
ncbi:MAG TPA: ribose-phosphate pyrophosphokinase [bacterium]